MINARKATWYINIIFFSIIVRDRITMLYALVTRAIQRSLQSLRPSAHPLLGGNVLSITAKRVSDPVIGRREHPVLGTRRRRCGDRRQLFAYTCPVSVPSRDTWSQTNTYG